MIEDGKCKFQDKYILGEGFPWVNLEDTTVNLSTDPVDNVPLELRVPKELWNETGVPKYRLVLERIHPRVQRLNRGQRKPKRAKKKI